MRPPLSDSVQLQLDLYRNTIYDLILSCYSPITTILAQKENAEDLYSIPEVGTEDDNTLLINNKEHLSTDDHFVDDDDDDEPPGNAIRPRSRQFYTENVIENPISNNIFSTAHQRIEESVGTEPVVISPRPNKLLSSSTDSSIMKQHISKKPEKEPEKTFAYKQYVTGMLNSLSELTLSRNETREMIQGIGKNRGKVNRVTVSRSSEGFSSVDHKHPDKFSKGQQKMTEESIGNGPTVTPRLKQFYSTEEVLPQSKKQDKQQDEDYAHKVSGMMNSLNELGLSRHRKELSRVVGSRSSEGVPSSSSLHYQRNNQRQLEFPPKRVTNGGGNRRETLRTIDNRGLDLNSRVDQDMLYVNGRNSKSLSNDISSTKRNAQHLSQKRIVTTINFHFCSLY